MNTTISIETRRLALMLSTYISIILISLFVFTSVALAAPVDSDVPDHLIGGLNLGADDSNGKEARAFFFINPDQKRCGILR